MRKLIQNVIIIAAIANALTIANDSRKLLNTQNLQGEKIFFIKKHNIAGMRLGDIYAIDSNGGEIQQITNFSKDFFITELPSISGDGKKLAFISNYEEWKSSNYIDAFVANLNTGTIERITGYEKATPISKTGTVIVTVNDPKQYALTPFAIRISYSGCNNFITGNSASLSVPANEDIWIKAVIAKGKGDVKVVKVSEGGSISVELDLSAGTISAESCALSFNGSYLAVSRNSETINFPWNKILIWDTNTKLPIAEVAGLKLGGDIFPTFSPDDSKLAFGTGEPQINSLGIISTNNVTAQPELIVHGNILGYQAFCTQPAWAPNGKVIAFVYTILSGLDIQSNIFTVNLTDGSISQITNFSGNVITSRPTFSPDCSQIAFTHLKSNSSTFSWTDLINGTYESNIYSINSNGGQTFALTNDGNSFDPFWGNVNTAVDVKEEISLNEFQLFQNYPNPFNPKTTIEYILRKSSNVKLKVFNIIGKEIVTLVNKKQSAGYHKVEFSADNLTSGIYFYRIEANNFYESKKCVVLK